jgi:hypothetical protein
MSDTKALYNMINDLIAEANQLRAENAAQRAVIDEARKIINDLMVGDGYSNAAAWLSAHPEVEK